MFHSKSNKTKLRGICVWKTKKNELLNGLSHAVMVVVGDGHIVRCLLDGGLCILHGHTHAGKAYHRAVIEAVAAGHEVVAGQPPAFQQTAEAHVLGDPSGTASMKKGLGG